MFFIELSPQDQFWEKIILKLEVEIANDELQSKG